MNNKTLKTILFCWWISFFSVVSSIFFSALNEPLLLSVEGRSLWLRLSLISHICLSLLGYLATDSEDRTFFKHPRSAEYCVRIIWWLSLIIAISTRTKIYLLDTTPPEDHQLWIWFRGSLSIFVISFFAAPFILPKGDRPGDRLTKIIFWLCVLTVLGSTITLAGLLLYPFILHGFEAHINTRAVAICSSTLALGTLLMIVLGKN